MLPDFLPTAKTDSAEPRYQEVSMSTDMNIKREPFPTESLPGPIANYVRQIANCMSCDESQIALATKVGLASSIGNSRILQLKSDYHEPAILWGANVALSGSGKSHISGCPIKPIETVQNELLTEFFAAHQSWVAADNSGPRPVATRHLIKDTTVENLFTIMAENPEGKLLEYADELESFTGGLDAYKNNGGDAQKYMSMWRGESSTYERKGDRNKQSHGIFHVPRASLSILGSITNDSLKRLMSEKNINNGWWPRFLLVCPPVRDEVWRTPDVSKLQEHLADMYERLRRLVLHDGNPVALRFDSEAGSRWEQFFNDHHRGAASRTGYQALIHGKFRGYVARFALIFHLTRVYGSTEPGVGISVDRKSLESAIEVGRWYYTEALRIYTMFQMTPEEEILQYIARKDGRATAWEVGRNFRRFKDTDEADKELSALSKAGKLQRIVKSAASAGRPSVIYRLTDSKYKYLPEGAPSKYPETTATNDIYSVGGAK